ncbi:unnamed protein product, partial [Cuscuta epithymum]
MGHPSSRVVRLLPISFKKCATNNCFNKNCDVCMRAKQTRECFPVSVNRALNKFELIHCDVWGPYREPSICGSRYFLTIVDDYSRAVWVHLMIEKSEVALIMQRFVSMVRNQFNTRIKVVRADNGTEFHPLRSYFQKEGVLFQTSCVGTPQQNGRVERKHRHILNVARALRFQANLPISFWGDCILTASYLINRTPSLLNDGKTPYEMLYDVTPSYAHIRIFGCLCYVAIKSTDKFQERGRKCVFLGYSYTQRGWKVMDLETKKHFVSRDVQFVETIFPFALPGSEDDKFNVPPTSSQQTIALDHSLLDDDDGDMYGSPMHDMQVLENAHGTSRTDTHDAPPDASLEVASSEDNHLESTPRVDCQHDNSSDTASPTSPQQP